MAQETMSEIDAYRETFEREYQTTRKLLHAFPPDKADLKPADKSRTARDLAWMLVRTQMVPAYALDSNEIKGAGGPTSPEKWDEILAAFDRAHLETATRLARATEAEWNSEFGMPVAPGQTGNLLRGKALWFFLYDGIHHRGEFVVYARMAGAKVPSIYGPTADEPWR